MNPKYMKILAFNWLGDSSMQQTSADRNTDKSMEKQNGKGYVELSSHGIGMGNMDWKKY